MNENGVRVKRVKAVLLGVFVTLSSVPGKATGDFPVVRDLGSDQYEVVFSYKASPGVTSVYLAGSFNGWSPTALKMDGPDEAQTFSVSIPLAKGIHQYKFVIEGREWRSDPMNPRQMGTQGNSVVYAGLNPEEGTKEIKEVQSVSMAGLAPYPETLLQLKQLIEDADRDNVSLAAGRWLERHPQPMFSDKAVSFVCQFPDADAVTVLTGGNGFRHGYAMKRLVDNSAIFVVSLNRKELMRNRSSYRFAVESAGASVLHDDPHAWSMTAEAGRIGALIAPADPKKGRVKLVYSFRDSAGKLRDRDLWVYLPPGYDRDASARYPVLYMHDGQNLWGDTVEPFGHGGWHVNDAADRLISKRKIRPFIGVGIANTPDRMEEYGPGEDIFSLQDHAYLRFLKADVKRYIDGQYRTLPGPADTAVMGSSMGGAISFQAVLLDPDTWGSAACLSSAFWIRDEKGNSYFDLVSARGKVPVRIYIDSGTAGERSDGAVGTRRMSSLLIESGWKPDINFLHFEDTGAFHNERAWSKRVDKPLLFLFGR